MGDGAICSIIRKSRCGHLSHESRQKQIKAFRDKLDLGKVVILSMKNRSEI
jgi:hypothetical protein